MKITIVKNHIGELIAAVILGFLEVLALSMYYRDSIVFWVKSAGNVFLFLGLWIVCAVLIYVFFRLIQMLCSPKRVIRTEEGSRDLFDRHPFLISIIVLTVFYLPWIIVFYPGSAIYDMMYQTVQADGFMAINAHHPIFATWVIGLFSQIGLKLTGGLNAGIFLYILLQSAVCVVSFAYMISYMTKLNVTKGWRIFTLCFLAVPPLWGGAMQCGTKDTMFMGLFVLFMVLSARLLIDRGKSFRTHTWIGYAVVTLLLCLFRNAIFIIMIPTFAVFFFALGKKNSAKKILAICALAALAVSVIFSTVTKKVYHTGTETGEMLSLPFQQTARYVRDHAGEMTEEEKEIVENTFVLDDYRKLGKLYYPMSSDPVKARYHWWASDDEKTVLKSYFSQWLSMLKKHPETYAEAAIAQTYGYYSITPVIKKQRGGAGTAVQFGVDQLAVQNVVDASDGALSESLVPSNPESLASAREVFSSWYYLWQKIPVLDLISKCGFYFLVLLAVTIYYGKRKNRLCTLAVPAFMLVLMAIASPVNEHIRYILPVVASLPVLISACAREMNSKLDNKES